MKVSMAESLFQRSAEVEEAPLQGELMLFDPRTSRFFVLNSTMSFVWRRCDGQHTVEAMAGELKAAFAGVEEEAAERDVRQALGELETLGLLAAAS
jgi:hypothetical protein